MYSMLDSIQYSQNSNSNSFVRLRSLLASPTRTYSTYLCRNRQLNSAYIFKKQRQGNSRQAAWAINIFFLFLPRHDVSYDVTPIVTTCPYHNMEITSANTCSAPSTDSSFLATLHNTKQNKPLSKQGNYIQRKTATYLFTTKLNELLFKLPGLHKSASLAAAFRRNGARKHPHHQAHP